MSLVSMLVKHAATEHNHDSLLGHKFGHTVFGWLSCCDSHVTGHEPTERRKRTRTVKAEICGTCHVEMPLADVGCC